MELDVRAFRTIQAALSETVSRDKRMEPSLKGRLAGGSARAKVVNPERRLGIAKKANAACWRKRSTEPSA
jgi:hypothetical protein